jgi:c-di-GMP-related signal transduction protein
MISLASQAGFELKFKKRMFLDAFFVSLLSEQYRDKPKPVALLSAFLIGLYSNLKSLFSGESSAVLYVFSPKA